MLNAEDASQSVSRSALDVGKASPRWHAPGIGWHVRGS